ncbi:hypothetical protein M0804_011863 [Polistes exclamans]|nr:hypothetical protein M0804_011863 [Polistes exclamans]
MNARKGVMVFFRADTQRAGGRRSIYLTATYGSHPEARPTKIPAACSSIHIDEVLHVRDDDDGVGIKAIKDVPCATRQRGPMLQGREKGRQENCEDDDGQRVPSRMTYGPDPIHLNFSSDP